MEKQLEKQLIKLLKIKSIISLLVTAVFCYLSIIGKVDVKDFMVVTVMIMTYFFNKDQKEVKENEGEIIGK